MRVILLIILNIIICVIFLLGIDLINWVCPLAKQDVAMGITFRFGAVVLFVSLLIVLLINLLLSRRKIYFFIPYLICFAYWISGVQAMPYRSWAYMFLSFVLIGVYEWFLIRYNKRGNLFSDSKRMGKNDKDTLKWSAQRAIESNLRPNVVAVTLGVNNKLLHIIAYVNSLPVEEDYEMVNDIAGEIICDFPDQIHRTKEECIQVNYKDTPNIKKLDVWITIKEI